VAPIQESHYEELNKMKKTYGLTAVRLADDTVVVVHGVPDPLWEQCERDGVLRARRLDGIEIHIPARDIRQMTLARRCGKATVGWWL